MGTHRITADYPGSRGEQMYYLFVLGVVILLSALGWLRRSRPQWFWRVFTGFLVIALAGSFVKLSLVDTWDKLHPVIVDLLRGMAAELVVTFLAVAVIERLLDSHNKSMDNIARSQLEYAASRQLSDLSAILTKLCALGEAGSQAVWSVGRLDRCVMNAEATFIRLASLRPEYLLEIEALLEASGELKERIWEFQTWVDRNIVEKERQKPWDALRNSASSLLDSVNIVHEKVSRPSLGTHLTTLNLSDGGDR